MHELGVTFYVVRDVKKVAEDKFKAIIPYQLKRVKNIILKKKVEH